MTTVWFLRTQEKVEEKNQFCIAVLWAPAHLL